jgi:hypothetical protein
MRPSLLTHSVTTIPMYSRISPLRRLFILRSQASTGTGRSAGAYLKRARNWASAMSNGAGQFGRQLASFVRSGSWRCTYTNTRT